MVIMKIQESYDSGLNEGCRSEDGKKGLFFELQLNVEPKNFSIESDIQSERKS